MKNSDDDDDQDYLPPAYQELSCRLAWEAPTGSSACMEAGTPCIALSRGAFLLLSRGCYPCTTLSIFLEQHLCYEFPLLKPYALHKDRTTVIGSELVTAYVDRFASSLKALHVMAFLSYGLSPTFSLDLEACSNTWPASYT